MSVDGVVYYRVTCPISAVANVTDAEGATRLLAQTTLRNALGTKNLAELLSDREGISHHMQVCCIHIISPWLALVIGFICGLCISSNLGKKVDTEWVYSRLWLASLLLKDVLNNKTLHLSLYSHTFDIVKLLPWSHLTTVQASTTIAYFLSQKLPSDLHQRL